MNKPHIYIVAAEKSGDELGARLAMALRAQTAGKITLSGIGGSAMQSQGIISPIDISPLSILGFLEALKSYPTILQKVNETTDLINSSGAQACVLIDSWGFMMRVAQRLKKTGYAGKIIKYVAPQVWAMRERRSKILAAGVDHLLTIHSFDAPYFTRYGLDVSYVGNPVFDTAYDTGNGKALRDEFHIPKTAPVLAVLFGSRLSEIQNLAAPFADAIAILKQKLPQLTVVSALSDTIATDVRSAAIEHVALQDVIFLGEERKLDCFAAADVSIACSGTVSTQLASAGVPTIIGYKLNALTYFVAKQLYKQDYVSMVNIAAKKALMPEFIQIECTGNNLAGAAYEYLYSEKKRESSRGALLQTISKMRSGSSLNDKTPSSERAANAVLSVLNKTSAC